VELFGLEGAKSLNGKCGRIASYVEETSRYGVRVEGIKEHKSVKPGNLRRLRCDPMPAAFIDSTVGTPVFKLLLQFLPADSLIALAHSQLHLRGEVQGADQAWERLLAKTFGGDLSMAKRRCADADSPFAGFITLSALRSALDTVEVIQGDLRHAKSLDVQAVVCPAVPSLRPYGPAARAVYDEAGNELLEHIEHAISEPLNFGEVQWTPAFGLGTDGLIHAVGPTQRTPQADGKLHQVYKAALECVKEHGHDSVAMGSISTGGNGIAPQIATLIAAEEIRNFFAKLGASEKLRIVIVAFEPEIRDAFQSALAKIKHRVNEELVEELPLIVLDSMVPRQRLKFDVDQLPTAVHQDMDRFAMIGMQRGPHPSILPFGVEVHVLSRSPSDTSCQLEVVAGRRFILPGNPTYEDNRGPTGRQYLWASVKWSNEDDEERPTSSDVEASANLEGLVKTWLQLVRAGHERQPGQMDMILEHMGPMPSAADVSERALWVSGLINPLPGLGVAWEIRPAALAATSAKDRLKVATDGIIASIGHLDGSRPMR